MKLQVLVLVATGLLVGIFLWGRASRRADPAQPANAADVSGAGEAAELQTLAFDVVGRALAVDVEPVHVDSIGVEEITQAVDKAGWTADFITGQVRGLDGHGIPGVRVHAQRGGGTLGSARTSDFGDFRIRVPQGIRINLWAVPSPPVDQRFGRAPFREGARGMEPGWVQREPVEAMGGDPPVVVTVGSGGVIEGRLLLHPEYGDMGMSVQLVMEDGDYFLNRAMPDEQGRFRFDGLQTGVYTVELVRHTSGLLAVAGIRAVVGEVTRDPRLDGLQLDSLLVRTRIDVLGPDGETVANPRLCATGEDGEILFQPAAWESTVPLTLPRNVMVTLWASDSGRRPGRVHVMNQEHVTIRLERGIEAMLRVAEVREWGPDSPKYFLSLRHVSTEENPSVGGLQEVFLDDLFASGQQQQVSFPGPGRYELWLSVFENQLAGVRVPNSTGWGSSSRHGGLLREIKLSQSLLISESDGGASLAIELPLEWPVGR